MKFIKLYSLVLSLFFGTKISAQGCTANFTYTLSPNGAIVFSNTSTHAGSITPVYKWDTGNGMSFTTTALSQTIATTYTSNGTYNVLLTMSTSIPNQCYTISAQSISVSILGCPLHADTSLAGGAYLSPVVNFSSTSTGTTSSTTYTWDFGDGTTSNLANPNHLYSGNGLYLYKLTASNNATCSSFISANALGAYGGPSTICFYTPSLSYTVSNEGRVNFSSIGVGIGSYVVWCFDDIPTDCYPTYDSLFSISHIYFNGTYRPSIYTLVGTFCGPFVDTLPAFTITNNPCFANSAFTYTAMSGGSVQFSKTAPPSNTNIAYLWDFGDGVLSQSMNCNHTYLSAGNYSVALFSYDNRYPLSYLDTNWVSPFCRAKSIVNLNITGIPCIANSNFSVFPSGMPHQYYINPDFPYNVSSAIWHWGDGDSSTTMYAGHTYSVPGNYNICLTVTTSCGATSSTCISQYVSKGVNGDMVYVSVLTPTALINGIKQDQEESSLIELFPNPSNGILNVRLSQKVKIKEIEIYNLLGERFRKISVKDNEGAIEIDVSDMSNGIYFLQLELPEKTETLKFIISK